MYNVDKDYLTGLPETPFRHGPGAYEGVVMHETAVENDSVERNKRVFGHRGWDRMNAFVHSFIDHVSIWLSASSRYRAWGAGPTSNARHLHLELCRRNTRAEFKASYDRWTWLAAKFLKDKGLDVIDGKTLVSHNWVTHNLGGTTHTDPIAYLSRWGKTWSDVVEDVKRHYADLDGGEPIHVEEDPMSDGYMENGESGEDVKNLQMQLESLGYELDVDGIYGDETESVVEKFQEDEGLSVDGIAGKNTLARLKEKTAVQLQGDEIWTNEFESTSIMGESKARAKHLISFVQRVNKDFNPEIAEQFIAVGETYNVRGDVAFCQSIHETNWFRFGGDVKAEQNNFAGIGATGGVPGNSFASIKEGVTAQIQHLYGYASKGKLPLGEKLLDPRFEILEDSDLRGTAPNWTDLGGKWAWPGYAKSKYGSLEEAKLAHASYGHSILKLYQDILDTQVPEEKDTSVWRMATGPFKTAEDLVAAKKHLTEKYPWMIYVKASDTNFNPDYRIWTGTFIGKETVERHKAALEKEFGWTIYLKKES